MKANKVKLRWKKAKEQRVKPKTPKRLTNIKEVWKYYFYHGNFHGMKYCVDNQFLPFERIIWVFTLFVGFAWAFKIIFEIYSEFQVITFNFLNLPNN